MTNNNFIKMFEDIFYAPTYNEWRVDNTKAGKDIVGTNYENFREQVYKSEGLTIGNGRRVLGTTYDADIVIVNNDGEIILIEECKGHYVDSCFLKRALFNFAQVIGTCIRNDKRIPYFVLSCPTRMNNFEDIFYDAINHFKDEYLPEFEKMFMYLPLCGHGRVAKSRYFLTEENCFVLDKKSIDMQNEFLKLL